VDGCETPSVTMNIRILLPLVIALFFVPNSYGNLISQPGFENGSSARLWGGSKVVRTNTYSGSYAAQLDDASQWGGGYEQTIYGLSPNTTYQFSAYVKSNGGEGRIGAKDFGATESSTRFSNSNYQKKSIKFTTGSTTTRATVFVYNPTSGAQYIYADNLSMVEVDSEFKLIFADEFNSNGSFDSSVWVAENGFKRNYEEQYYLSKNVRQRNGNLVITAKRETVANEAYDPNSSNWKESREYAYWTSGSIATFKKFNFLYGRVVTRAKVSNLPGTWPAIWTVGDGIEWPAGGEIDIMENYQGKILANYATAGNGRWNASWDGSSTPVSELGENWANRYHIWTMDWTPDRIAIYVDGILLNEFDPGTKNSSSSQAHPGIAPFQTFKQALWLNLAVGGQGGSTAALPDTTEYLVDYIRVYQKSSGTNLLGNPGFENGGSSDLWGGSSVVTNNQKSGQYATKLEDNSQWGGGYERQVQGLSPNTTYVFKVWVKSSGGEGMVGVKDHGAAAQTLSFTDTAYVEKSIQFTTGANATSLHKGTAQRLDELPLLGHGGHGGLTQKYSSTCGKPPSANPSVKEGTGRPFAFHE